MALLLFTKIKIPLRILCLPVLIPFLLSTAFAQSRVVSGKVFDQQNNDNLPGVTVIQKGTKNGTLTNEDGTFSLSLIGDAEQTLVFNFIGYALQEMDVSQTSTVNIGMADDILSLDEVVVIGYDAVRKSDLTGAVSSIKGDEILKTGRATLEESLLGRLAGVQVQPTDGTPGGGIAIRIRGGSSLTAGNQPLYVIDGFPLTPAANGFENPMVNLNPADIESIEVLKDASATAIYGANGANGVVIITTKQGKNSGGKPKVNVTGFYGFSNIAENIDNVSPEQHTQFLTEFYWNDRKFTASQAWATVPGEAGTDYLDKYTRTGEIQRVSASVQNGTDNGLSYFASLSYHNEEPILVNSTFERFTGNVKVRQEVGKFDMGINMYYGQTNKSGYVHNDYSIFGSVFRNLANTRPFAGVDMRPFFQAFSDEVDLDSESDDPFQDEAGAGVFEDFDAVFYGGVNESRRQDIRVNIDASYDIFDWLNLSAYYGFNRAENPSEIFNESTTLAGTPGGNARITFSNFEDDVFNTKLAFNKIVNQHSINAIALYERRSNSYSWVSQTASNFSSEVLTTRNFGLADIIGIPAIFEGRETIESYAGRVNYNFAGRYLFTASFRADASSKFSENNKWGYFPSASAAWRISEEAFMASVDQVSNLKVRVGWGTSGNSQIGFYPSFDELVSFKYPLDGEPATAILTEDELANNNVKWETVEQLNIGLDIGLFNNRINITADYYNKITRDLLLENQLPSTTGFEFITENVGSVRNRGFEFAVSSVNIKKPKFTWSTDFNISFNRSKVLDLGPRNQIFFTTNLGGNIDNNILLQVGQPVGIFYGFILDEVFNTSTEVANSATHQSILPGHQKFVDINRDGVIDDLDRVPIGDTNPDFIGGLANNFRYKNFDFSFVMHWSYGNDIVNGNIASLLSPRSFRTTINPIINNIYSFRHPQRNYVTYKNASKDGTMNSEYIEDGSFLKLDRVTLGYTANLNPFRLRLYGTVINVFNINRYSWTDPEVSVSTGAFSQIAPGVDIGAYPWVRQYQIGLNLDF